jgi:hypothetical protein
LASQLRIYRIKEGRMGEWLSGWTQGVLPLRRKFGFRIEGAWVAAREATFVWILSYDGPEGFEARDAAYYASAERRALRPDPAPLIEKSEQHMIEDVLVAGSP